MEQRLEASDAWLGSMMVMRAARGWRQQHRFIVRTSLLVHFIHLHQKCTRCSITARFSGMEMNSHVLLFFFVSCLSDNLRLVYLSSTTCMYDHVTLMTHVFFLINNSLETLSPMKCKEEQYIQQHIGFRILTLKSGLTFFPPQWL